MPSRHHQEDDEKIRILCEEADALWGEHDWDGGVAKRREALELAEKSLGGSNPLTLYCLSQVAFSLYFIGSYAESGVLYDRLTDKAEDCPVSDQFLADVWQRAALTQRALERERGEAPSRSHELLEKANELFQRACGDAPAQLVGPLCRLAISWTEKGDGDRGEALFRKMMEMIEAFPDISPPEKSWMLAAYADYLREAGRTDEAERLRDLGSYDAYKFSLDRQLAESIEQFGEQHPAVAEVYANIGHHHRHGEQFAQALSCFKKALAIQQAVLGDDHADVAATWTNISAVHRATQSLPEAEDAANKAISIQIATVGRESHDYARSLENLGWLRQLQHDDDAAEALLREALEITRQVLGKRTWRTLEQGWRLSLFLFNREDYAGAAALLEELIADAQHVSELSAGELGDYYNTYAAALEKAGRAEDAEKAGAQRDQLYAVMEAESSGADDS